MKKFLTFVLVVLVIVIGLYVYTRHSASFFYTDGKIDTHTSWAFNAEEYKVTKDGFIVEKGNFLCTTEEIFETGTYTYRFKVIGIPVEWRNVNYNSNSAWGFPGLPAQGSEMFKGWFVKGEQRFKETAPIVELYKNQKK